MSGARVGDAYWRVQTLHTGAFVRDALPLVPVDLTDRVVDVHGRHRLGPGQQPRHYARQPSQHPGGVRVELLHLPELERPQNVPTVDGARAP